MESSLQETYAPRNACFGCGPANPKGIHVRSFPVGDDPYGEVVATWTPEKMHEAFDDILCGGIIGTLLDCHSNWTAAWHLMRRDGLETPPCTVTGEYHIRLKRPTPTGGPVQLSARAVESKDNKVVVEATLGAGGEVTATCRGTFFAVQPGHPAYRRW